MNWITHNHFASHINRLCKDINDWAIRKGFWDGNRNDGEMIALMHSELSESLEALRHNNPPDKDCPDFSCLEIELADTVIRIMDYCGARKLRLGDAILAKMDYNETRPHKHGKEF